MRKAGLQRKVGYEWFHENVNSAVEFCVRHAAAHKAILRAGPSGADDEEVGAGLDAAGPGIRRRGNTGNEDKEATKSVLVLAAKHRVVDGPARRTFATPEQRALAALEDGGEETQALGDAPPPPTPAWYWSGYPRNSPQEVPLRCSRVRVVRVAREENAS